MVVCVRALLLVSQLFRLIDALVLPSANGLDASFFGLPFFFLSGMLSVSSWPISMVGVASLSFTGSEELAFLLFSEGFSTSLALRFREELFSIEVVCVFLGLPRFLTCLSSLVGRLDSIGVLGADFRFLNLTDSAADMSRSRVGSSSAAVLGGSCSCSVGGVTGSLVGLLTST